MLTLVNNSKEANAITHAGTFHADDVFASVFLSKMFDLKLYRTNNIEEVENIEDKIVFDIGLKEFDHHGLNARVRENGIKYSSFGLLFEHFGKKYLQNKNIPEVEECYLNFLKEFVIQIDAIDNGFFPPNPKEYTVKTLDDIIGIMNKTWREISDNSKEFIMACQIAEIIFDRIEKRIIDKMFAKELVEKAIVTSKDEILVLEEYMPFMDVLLTSKEEKANHIKYAIMPSNRGGFNIRAINSEMGTHNLRLPFPKEWGGKTKEELVLLTKIPSFRFCHTGLFLCSCETLEDAIKIAKLAIKQK